jgi:hypothetical protein
MKISGKALTDHMAHIENESKLRDLKILRDELPQRIAEARNALAETSSTEKQLALKDKLSNLESLFAVYQARVKPVGSGQ